MDMTPYLAAVPGFSSMFSLTTSILSPYSAAMASRDGAIWRHGPHQAAQKSTRTGLSLLRTSCSKESSVTFFRVPATAGSLTIGAWGGWGSDGGLLGLGLVLVREGGEEALGVESGGTTGAGRGDGLAVGVVDHVTGAEDARDVGAGGGRVDLEVALLVQLQLTLEELGARVVADRDEQTGDRQVREFAGLDIAQLQTGELLVAQNLGDLAVPDERDLRVGEGAFLHRLGGAQGVPAVDDRDRLG